MGISDIIQACIAVVTFLGVAVALVSTICTIRKQNRLSLFDKRCKNYMTLTLAVKHFENIKDKIEIDEHSFKNSDIPGILEFIGGISFDNTNETLQRNDLEDEKNRLRVLHYINNLTLSAIEIKFLFKKHYKNGSVFLDCYSELIKTLYEYEVMLIADKKEHDITHKTATALNDFISLEKLYQTTLNSYINLIDDDTLTIMKKDIL